MSKKNNPRSNTRTTTRRTRKGRNNRNRTNGGLLAPQLPRSLISSFPFPTSRIVNLHAIFNFTMGASATFQCDDFQLNSLFNFNSTGGTTTDFSGTTQLAAIYDSYHVQRIAVKFELNSVDSTQPSGFGLIFKDVQPSTVVTTRVHAINALEVTPTTGPFTVGVASGMGNYRSQVYNLPVSAVLGNPLSYMADVNYTANFGADPAQKLWMGAICYSVGGSAMVNGLEVALSVDLQVRVYSLKVLEE